MGLRPPHSGHHARALLRCCVGIDQISTVGLRLDVVGPGGVEAAAVVGSDQISTVGLRPFSYDHMQHDCGCQESEVTRSVRWDLWRARRLVRGPLAVDGTAGIDQIRSAGFCLRPFGTLGDNGFSPWR